MRVALYSLGCKVNIYESEYVSSLLRNHGYEIVPFDKEADIYIINTCSVTNESDKKSRKIIHQVKRNHKEAIVVVMGCYSQVKSDEIDADIVLGNKDKSKILEYIATYLKNHKEIKKIYNLREDNEFEAMRIDKFDNHTRAFVKIQDGCNAFCSYCIIPYTRGKIRSKKKEDVLLEVRSLVEHGYHEIVLTGIHTGKYGMDLEDTNLEDLLRSLIAIPDIYRIRLSSIEIHEITDGIMDLIEHSSVIASHFHIPLQSGADKILKLMNRTYDTEYFIKKIQKIKSLRSDISITTDLIVGFPNETDEDFRDTVRTIEEIGFTKIHTFPYSPREGTVASEMENQVDGRVKKERVQEILKLSSRLEGQYYQNYIGKIMEGIVEVHRDGKRVVLTSNYISVYVDEFIENNRIVKVRINKVDSDNNVFGEVVS